VGRGATGETRRFWPFAAAAGKGSDRPGCDIQLERAPAAGAHTVSRFVDWRTCQYHRNLHLSIRDVPVSLEKRRLVRWRDQLEAVARVEANCPICSFPGANQDAPRAQLPQMPKESPTNAAPLAARQDVSVTNKLDVTDRLDAHHARKAAVFLITLEHDTSGDLIF